MADDIGIPNVPAIVHEFYQRRARARLDAGLCPDHNTPMIERGNEEVCLECEERRDGN